jgi:hypothetical protein
MRFIRSHGTVGDGTGYSRKLSFRLLWEPRDVWIGAYWNRMGLDEWVIYVCLLPCLPILVHYVRSYGGTYPR